MPRTLIRGTWWWPPLWSGFQRVIEMLWADERSWRMEGRQLPAGCGIQLPATTRAGLATLLLETGIALTPARSIWRPAAWFAVFRYAEAFAPASGKLRLIAETSQWDSRLVGVMAEELAVGVAMHIAHEYLDVVHAADVLPLVRAREVTLRSVPADPESPEARPDFLCLDRNNQRIFLEAKGAVGTESRLRADLEHGKTQVNNVDAPLYPPRTRGGAPSADRLVVATHFCVDGAHPRSETTTVVLDPPVDGEPARDREQSDLAIRLSYAKALAMGDAELFAERLLRRVSWQDLGDAPELDLDVDGAPPLRVIGAPSFGGALVVHDKVWRALWQHHEVDLPAALAEALEAVTATRTWVDERADVPLIVLPNGIGVVW